MNKQLLKEVLEGVTTTSLQYNSNGGDYCVFCYAHEYRGEWMGHEDDCVVTKAYILLGELSEDE